MHRLPICLCLLVPTAACTEPLDGETPGQKTTVVRGIVQSSLPENPDEMEAILFWARNSGDGTVEGHGAPGAASDGPLLWTSAPVDGSFPSNFTLSVNEPPPFEAMFRGRGKNATSFAFARVGIMKPGEDAWDPEAVLGLNRFYLLVYLDAASVPGSDGADPFTDRLGEPLGAGFHLLERQVDAEVALNTEMLERCTTALAVEGCTTDEAAAVCEEGFFGPETLAASDPHNTAIEVVLKTGAACGSPWSVLAF